MNTRRDGLARYATRWTRACRYGSLGLEILAVILPRHAVHPGRGLGPKRPVGRPQAIDIDMVQERSEPRIPVLLATRRTRSSALVTLTPALCPGRVLLAAFSLPRP